MARQVPWDDIQDDRQIFPERDYLGTIEAIEELATREAAKLMYLVTLRITDPAEFAKERYAEFFVIGSDSDPDAEDPETWKRSIGASRMKRLLKAANVALNPDMDRTIEKALGRPLGFTLRQKVAAKVLQNGAPNPRAGQVSNEVQRYFVAGQSGRTAAATQVATEEPRRNASEEPKRGRGRPPKAAKAPAQEEDEGWGEEYDDDEA